MVSDFTVGDRVGVGFLGGHCDFVNCENQPHTGLTADGGYAEMVYGRASGRPDALVAIQGIGGLGHIGGSVRKQTGLPVVAIARGTEKEALATKLGADHFVDSAAVDPAQALQQLGNAAGMIATAASGASMSSLVGGPLA